MTSSDDVGPVFPKQWAPYKWSVVGLVSSCILVLIVVDPSPLRGWLCWGNYHLLHIPWGVFGVGLIILTLLLPCLILLSTFIVIRKARAIRTTYAPRLMLLPSWAIFIVAIFMVFSPVMDGGYTWVVRERMDAIASESYLRQGIDFYIDDHLGRWPPHLAVLLDNASPLRQARYRYSKTPELPANIKLDDPNKWQAIAGVVESHIDFVYVGGDLTNALTQRKEAAQIIVIYGKYDLPEIPAFSFNWKANIYEYYYAARPVAFADGHVSLVPIEEVAKVFAEHNAARLKVGLPEQVIRP